MVKTWCWRHNTVITSTVLYIFSQNMNFIPTMTILLGTLWQIHSQTVYNWQVLTHTGEPSIIPANDLALSSLHLMWGVWGLPVLSTQLSSSCSLSLQETVVSLLHQWCPHRQTLLEGIKWKPTWPSRIFAVWPPSHSSQPLHVFVFSKDCTHTLLSLKLPLFFLALNLSHGWCSTETAQRYMSV